MTFHLTYTLRKSGYFMTFSSTSVRCPSEEINFYVQIDYYHFIYNNKSILVCLNPVNSFEYDYTILYDGIMYRFTPSYRNKQPYIPRLGAECIHLLESQLKQQ